MADDQICGPIDFLLLSFDEASNDGSAGAELLDLIDRGIIALYDVRVIRRTADGWEKVDMSAMPNAQATGFAEFIGAESGLLDEEDLAAAAELLEPGRAGVLLVYENSWSRRFIAAAAKADAHMLASARIPAETEITSSNWAVSSRKTRDGFLQASAVTPPRM